MSNQPNGALIGFLLFALLTLPAVFAWGKIYDRTGFPSWYLFGFWVPILNLYVMGRLLRRAGYPSWWALLIFVPFGFVGLTFKLAYGEWPAEDELVTARQAARISATVPLMAWVDRTKVIRLAGSKVQTFDNTLRILEGPDFQSAVKSEVSYGTVLQLGATTEIAGRQWIEATLPDGTAGYVLAASVRSHAIIL
jgi:hypothetical protein